MTNTNTAVQQPPIEAEYTLLGEDGVKQYDNNNTGSLFKNNKRTKESQPNSRGRVEVDGKHFWVSGWTRKSGAGEPYISLAFTEMTAEDIAKYVK